MPTFNAKARKSSRAAPVRLPPAREKDDDGEKEKEKGEMSDDEDEILYEEARARGKSKR